MKWEEVQKLAKEAMRLGRLPVDLRRVSTFQDFFHAVATYNEDARYAMEMDVLTPTINVVVKSAIDEAKEIIYGDREKTYGSPQKNLNVIADYWMEYLNTKPTAITKHGTVDLSAEDVCIMMVLLKIARQANNYKRDNIVDAIGYLSLIDRIATETSNTETDKT